MELPRLDLPVKLPRFLCGGVKSRFLGCFRRGASSTVEDEKTKDTDNEDYPDLRAPVVGENASKRVQVSGHRSSPEP